MSDYAERSPQNNTRKRSSTTPQTGNSSVPEYEELIVNNPRELTHNLNARPPIDSSALSPDMARQLQNTIGNHATSQIVQSKAPATSMINQQTAPNSALMREEDDNYVGTQPDSGMTETRADGSEVSPGDQGFSQAALASNAEITTWTLEGIKELTLTPVQLDLSHLDSLIDTRAQQEEEIKQKKAGETIWGAPGPYFQKYYSSILKEVSKHKTDLTTQKATEARLQSDFNSWSLRANQMYVSAAKLSALQLQFGATDNESLIAALEEGLTDAKAVAVDTEVADITAPESDETVSAMAENTERKRQQMETAWLGFKRSLVLKERDDVLNSITDDQTRLTEIRQIIQTMKNIGKTVDLSLSVMKGMQAVGNAGATLDDAGNWSNNTGTAMQGLGNTVATGVGIPTSAEGVVGGIAELVYSDEIKKINRTISIAKGKAVALSALASQLDLQQDIETFENAVEEFEAAAQNEARALNARRIEYLRLGQMLDREARGDRDNRRAGLAPGRGEERYAAIMLLTATIREVLAIGKANTEGFKSPDALYQELNEIKNVREARVKSYGSFSLTDAELEAFNHVYGQTLRYHNTYTMLAEMFGGIESSASELMMQLNPGTAQGNH